jgi:hypothetical protein
LEVAENVREPNPIYVEQVLRVIELLQGKWTVQILCEMREGPVRLGQLSRFLPEALKVAIFENSLFGQLTTKPKRDPQRPPARHAQRHLSAPQNGKAHVIDKKRRRLRNLAISITCAAGETHRLYHRRK